MIPFDKHESQKIHGRTISVATYAYDQESIVVEGRLTDNRFQQTYYLNGESRLPGIVHDLVVRMRVKGPDLVIEDIEVEMHTVPREDCRQIIDSLQPVKGMKIRHGFTNRVKAAVGGSRGCSHLVELLLAMAPAAVQGAWSAVAAKPIDSSKISGHALAFLDNTCWVWRSDGPLMQELKAKIKEDGSSIKPKTGSSGFG